MNSAAPVRGLTADVRLPDLSVTTLRTIPQCIISNAAERGGESAVECGDRRLNWAQMASDMKSIAGGLVRMGCRPGDRVAILADNSIEYVQAIVGIVCTGAVVVPLPVLVSEQNLCSMMDNAGIRCLFASAHYQAVAERLWSQRKNSLEGGRIALDFEAAEWTTLTALKAFNSEIPLPPANLDAEFNIIYSSGTTGVPKGIVHSHRLRAVQSKAFGNLGYDSASRTVISTPLYANFSFGAILVAFWAGGTVVLLHRFSEENFLEACRERAPTHAFVVPAQIQRLLAHPDFDRSVRSVAMLKYVAGSPLRESIKHDVLERWPGPLVETYGMTEGGAVTMLLADRFPDKLASVGQAVGGCEIVVIDAQGKLLSAGEIGEIAGIAGPAMTGYNRNKDATDVLAWTAPNGRQFLRSGDLGYLDADGFLFLTGRRKDLIISGGLNIYAVDLEEALLSHPDVVEAAVVGIPSERFGESPLGLVVLKPGAAVTVGQLLSWANGRLGKLHRLIGVECRDALPRGPIGKVLKDELRQPYWDVAGQV